MIERFADGVLKELMSDISPENMAKVTPERVAEKRQELVAWGEQLVESFKSKEATWEAYQRGRFSYSNKHSRALFEEATGISLGKSDASAKIALEAYVGADVIEARTQRLRSEYQARQQAAAEKEAKRRAEYIAALTTAIKADVAIEGTDLVEIARECGVEIHPRTVGTLRKRVLSINSCSARIRGKQLPNSVYGLYRQVRDYLSKPTTKAEIVAA